ncbi:capsular biosynthesis protein CpsJ [Pseudoalteromonas sp. S4488]|uniref:oligosaccharide flippase family protein n=1 Tax=unclassified Pseudoalteromonas TaxID=194690 RepID=UPI0010237403|nr:MULTISPECIES: oligosaccharide flippase family protein [unclassified Pseudoalteromonas]RZF77291.1 flippase [Pseudoalteromonas sp. CO109Y]TMO33393.1 capsular biosynthesis protein CpsJ [Pseudoalteromonas sp. S4491]TMO33885.1 capsular biosynthesis protein CpsJ [Pseudoalteromonas sp. S4488]
MKSKIKALLADKEHRHTVINSLLALAIRVLGAGMSFVFNLIIARQLGADEAGYFFLGLALVMLLSGVARLGFDNTILRFTSAGAENGYTVKAILNFALKYVLPVAFIFAVITYAFAPWLADNVFNKPGLTDTLQLIAPAIIGLSIVFLVAMSLQARHKLIASIPCQNIAHFMLCGAAVIVFSADSASTAALYLSLSLGGTSSFFYWLSIKSLNNSGEKPDPQQLWHSARPNWIIIMMSQAVQWCAPIIIGVFLVAEQVAFFSVAQRIALLTTFILMAVNLVVAPKFSAFHAKGDDVGIRKTALFSVRLLVLSAFPIVLFMLFFPEFLMSLFGDEFKQGALILQILVLGQAVNVITGSVGFLLMMSGYERDMRLVTLISGFGVLISVPIFTKLLGAVGAASATAFFISLQNLLAVYFVKKRLGFNTLMFWQKI